MIYEARSECVLFSLFRKTLKRGTVNLLEVLSEILLIPRRVIFARMIPEREEIDQSTAVTALCACCSPLFSGACMCQALRSGSAGYAAPPTSPVALALGTCQQSRRASAALPLSEMAGNFLVLTAVNSC